MSDAPDKFPIEPGIVPLVYAFYTLRLLHPCWSCEGHLYDNGMISPPKIWFYAAHPLYARLLSEHLCSLKANRRLKNDWMVQILPNARSSLTITYSLEPVSTSTGRPAFEALRADIHELARDLREQMQALAQYHKNKTGTLESQG